MGPAIEILADFGGNACDPGNWSAIAGQSINNQLAIMLIKTTATASLGLGGLGGGFCSVACMCQIFTPFSRCIDLTDKTDRTKQG